MQWQHALQPHCLSTVYGQVLISFSVPHALQRYPLQYKVQVLAADLHTVIFAIANRQFIGAFFQTFMVQGKAVPFKQQQLYLVVLFVEEDKHRPA